MSNRRASNGNSTTRYGTTRVGRNWLINGEHWFTRWTMGSGMIVEFCSMDSAWLLLSERHPSQSEQLPQEVAFFLLRIGLLAGKGRAS